MRSVDHYAVTYGRNHSPLSRNLLFCMNRYECSLCDIFMPNIGRSRIYKHTQAEKQTNSKKPTIMLTMLLPIVEIVHLFRS